MRTFQLGRVIALAALCAAYGCDDGGSDEVDSGTGGSGGTPGLGGGAPLGGGAGGGAAGGGSGGADPGMDAGLGGAGGDAPDPDAAIEPEADAAVAPAPDAGPAVEVVAAVVLTEQPQVPQASVAVSVTEAFELMGEAGCVTEQVDPNAQAEAVATYDGGEITVEGGAGGPYVYTPQGERGAVVYTTQSAIPDDIFADEGMLRATGAGGPDLEPFDLTLAAPPAVNISEPASGGFPEQFDKSDPLEVRWNGAASDSLVITIFPIDLGGEAQRGTWAVCAVDDNGSFDVPADVVDAVFVNQFTTMLVGITRTRVASAELGDDVAVLTALTSAGAPFSLRP